MFYKSFIIVLITSTLCLKFLVCSENDFAEFEDFEESIEVKTSNQENVIDENKPSDSDENLSSNIDKDNYDANHVFEDVQDDEADVKVQDEELDEFSHFLDEEEFEGFNSDKQSSGGKNNRAPGEPKITIAKVPLHLRSNWDSFYLEMLMIAGLGIYFLNFMIGRNKNQRIASTWLQKHRSLLDANFSLIGDDGKAEITNPGLIKESENIYILWCSGRTLVEGMLVELKLLKRQDLVSVMSQLIKPSSDQLTFNITIDDMDSFVFTFGTKKSIAKLGKEMADIGMYCPEKRTVEEFAGSNNFAMHSEVREVSLSILRDPKVMAIIEKYPHLIEYFHFSDQYSGLKQQDDNQTMKVPEVKKMLIFCFNFPKDDLTDNSIENMKPLTQLVFYLTDKITKLRLSKDSKLKAEKNRAKVQEAFVKAAHSARAEMAQSLREEKRRKERERIMSLDDPEKQRKWEEKEQKRQMKKRAPKIKTMKIKPM